MRRLCVFAGAGLGSDSAYRNAAQRLGGLLAQRGVALVYGGASVGLMGAAADAVLAAGGEAIGVIPQALIDRELAHRSLTELRTVASMHERKATMSELSDAFLALPGGLGTLDELMEALTWSQLGIHAKPSGLLNVNGYYDELISQLDRAAEEGFLRGEMKETLLIDDDPEALLRRLEECVARGEREQAIGADEERVIGVERLPASDAAAHLAP